MDELLRGVIWILGAVFAGTIAIFAFWRTRSIIRIWRAPKRPLHSVQAVIWRDPGDVSRLDLAAGPGGHDGYPAAPFRFLEEHLTGSQPCVSVRDARGRVWRVKWGDEVNAEALATRLAWAAGYFVEITHYVAEGRVDGATGLTRAAACLDAACRFRDARFELDEPGVVKHFDEHSWAWNDNPFVGTRELNGLKIVMMWLSNWDAKDVRDVARGSNTAIFEYALASGFREARYLIIDWGGAFGQWGTVVRRGRWDCHAFAAESDAFITGVDGDVLRFGYTGQRTSDITDGIRVSDAQWLLGKLGHLSEPQIVDAVRASGGTSQEAAVFSRALRARLEQLGEAAAKPPKVAGGIAR
ncbi:MAG TPA: hypothetical protein VMO26_04395 [Vicinamibacterales bacterium]|nr:hypothetical protein [Vicinamibacterales bacterium]